jgi:hypothetical protein
MTRGVGIDEGGTLHTTGPFLGPNRVEACVAPVQRC